MPERETFCLATEIHNFKLLKMYWICEFKISIYVNISIFEDYAFSNLSHKSESAAQVSYSTP